jgi:hypothetical protein
MVYIIVGALGGAEFAQVVTDENGEVMVFDDRDEAQDYADEEINAGVVVELPY